MSGNQVGRRTAEKAKIICPPPSGVDIIPLWSCDIEKNYRGGTPDGVFFISAFKPVAGTEKYKNLTKLQCSHF